MDAEPQSYKKILWVVALVFGVIVGSGVGLRVYLSKRISAQIRPDVRQFLTMEWDIPPSWRDAPAFSDSLAASAEKLASECEKFSWSQEEWAWLVQYQLLFSAGEISAESDAAFEDHLVETARLRQAATDLVAQPDYEVEAWPKASHGGINLQSVVWIWMALCANADHLGRSQQWAEAFDSAMTAMRIALRHPASDRFMHHMVGSGCVKRASISIGGLARICDDAEQLREALAELSGLDPRINLNASANPLLIAAISQLRGYQRAGEQVAIPEKATSKELVALCMEIWERRMIASKGDPAAILEEKRQLVVEAFSEDIPSELARKMIARLAVDARFAEPELTQFFPLPPRINTKEFRVTEKVAHCTFDLARVALARRLAKIETGVWPGTVRSLAPTWLDEAPSDPFSGEAFLWDPVGERFYSVGPDGVDDLNQLRYDAVNGLESAGDISVP